MAVSAQKILNVPVAPTSREPGDRAGRLTLRRPVGTDPDGVVVWECDCDCGRTTTVRTNHLCTGEVLSCGCANAVPLRLGEGTGALRVETVLRANPWVNVAVVGCRHCGQSMTVRGTAREIRDHLRSRGCTACSGQRVSRQRTKDLTGQVFDLLTVLRRATEVAAEHQHKWVVQCECGTVKTVWGGHLRSRATRTCGAKECRAALGG